jgi:hypothetical protein
VRRSTDILLVHDGDPIGISAASELATHGLVHRVAAPTDDLVDKALGCRAIIASAAYAHFPRLRAAAEMPGVGALVLVERGSPDLAPLRRSGLPYTVLRPAPLLEEIVGALAGALASGRLVLARDGDPTLSWVSARDVARCAIAAIDSDDACGRVLDVVAPERLPLSELAARVARASGRRLVITKAPRWALVALRALGRKPFVLPAELAATLDGSRAHALFGDAWSTIEGGLAPAHAEMALGARIG